LTDRDRHPGHADPDPADPYGYQLEANEKVDKLNFFPEKFYMLTKILKFLTMMSKRKHCKLAML
jgi:hypothetical protein